MTPPAPRPRDLAGTLIRHAAGLTCDAAAAELIAAHHTWLARTDFITSRIHAGTRHDGHPYAWIDWESAVTALDGHRLSCTGSRQASCASPPASATPPSPSTSPACWAPSTTPTSPWSPRLSPARTAHPRQPGRHHDNPGTTRPRRTRVVSAESVVDVRCGTGEDAVVVVLVDEFEGSACLALPLDQLKNKGLGHVPRRLRAPTSSPTPPPCGSPCTGPSACAPRYPASRGPTPPHPSASSCCR